MVEGKPYEFTDAELKEKAALARRNVQALKAQRLAKYKKGLLTQPVRASLIPK